MVATAWETARTGSQESPGHQSQTLLSVQSRAGLRLGWLCPGAGQVLCGVLMSGAYYLSVKEVCLELHNCIFGPSSRRDKVLRCQRRAPAQGL